MYGSCQLWVWVSGSGWNSMSTWRACLPVGALMCFMCVCMYCISIYIYTYLTYTYTLYIYIYLFIHPICIMYYIYMYIFVNYMYRSIHPVRRPERRFDHRLRASTYLESLSRELRIPRALGLACCTF